MLDTLDAEHDRRIAAHVLKMHRSAPPRSAGTTTSASTSTSGASGSSGVYARTVNDDDTDAADEDAHTPRYSLQFLKKYILYARHAVQPVLGSDATRAIVDAFEELRARTHEQRTQPVTPRTLETLIRLSTAHAKARLAREVSLEDTRQALALVTHALYHDEQSTAQSSATPTPSTQTASATQPSTAGTDKTLLVPVPVSVAVASEDKTRVVDDVATSAEGSATQRSGFAAQVARVFREARETVQLQRAVLLERVNALRSAVHEAALSEADASQLLEALVDEGRLTYVDAEAVYL